MTLPAFDYVEPASVEASSAQRFVFRYRPGPAGLFAGGGFGIRLPIDPVHRWLGFARPQQRIGDRQGDVECGVWRGERWLRKAEPVMGVELKSIVGFEIPIDRIEGKFKLNQNRSRKDQERVAATLETSEDPAEREIARLMRENLRR